MKNNNDNFKSKRLLKISVNKTEKSKQIIQVMQWGENKPTLEKRGYYLKDGEWMTGKSMGFNLDDFKKILNMKDEIKEALAKEPEIDDDDDEDYEDKKPSKKSKKKSKKHHDADDDED